MPNETHKWISSGLLEALRCHPERVFLYVQLNVSVHVRSRCVSEGCTLLPSYITAVALTAS